MPQETHAFPTSAVHSRSQQARGTATTQAAPPNARVFIDSDACDPGGCLLLALVHPLWRRHCPRVEVESALQQLLVIGSARDATGVTPKQRRGNTTHTHTPHIHTTHQEKTNRQLHTTHHTPHTTHHTPHTTTTTTTTANTCTTTPHLFKRRCIQQQQRVWMRRSESEEAPVARDGEHRLE